MALSNCLACQGTYVVPAVRPLPTDCLRPHFVGKPKNIFLVPCNAAVTLIPSFYPIAPNTPTTVSSAIRTAVTNGQIITIAQIENDFAMSNNEPNKVRYGCKGMYMSGAGGTVTFSTVMRKLEASPLVAGSVFDATHESFYTSLNNSNFSMMLIQTCDDLIYGIFNQPSNGFVDTSKTLQPFDFDARQTNESITDCDMSFKWNFTAETTCGKFMARPLLNIQTLPAAEIAAWAAAIPS